MTSTQSLQPTEQWKVLDSTKIQSFMTCPRQYFYNYMLNWDKAEANVHLVFGEAWHKAMETLLIYGYSRDALVLAQMELEKVYRPHFSEMSDGIRFPKTPGFAAEMLSRYVERYVDDLKEFEVLHTEVSGCVGITDDLSVYFKTDSILRKTAGFLKGKIFSLEHKTTRSIDHAWSQQWSLKTQVGVYTHVLNCMFPPEDVYGVIINAAVFQKTKPGFLRFHQPRTKDQMASWLFTTKLWMESILAETECLTQELTIPASGVMLSFPMNTESCSKYFGCAYHHLCVAWHNPLEHTDIVPDGFVVRCWDPREQVTSTKWSL
jgi:hypothetical protein